MKKWRIKIIRVRDFRHVPPMTIEELKKNMPETSTAIQEEILKQENLLEHLHNTVCAIIS